MTIIQYISTYDIDTFVHCASFDCRGNAGTKNICNGCWTNAAAEA